jgi:GGDEF domain-containing protein
MGRHPSLALAFAFVFACIALLMPLDSHARHILDLDVASQPAQLRDWGDFAIDESGTATLQEMLARPQDFAPTSEGFASSLRPGQALWIRVAVPATPDDQRWYLRIVQPGLDSVAIHTRGIDDNWSVLQTGDALPVSRWALPNLHPVLPLSISAADPTNYMVRIQASDGLAAPIEFVSESWMTWDQQRQAVLYGIYFGLLAMGAIFALASAVVLRDFTYLWFSLWTVLSMLAAATAAGVTQLHLWPEAPRWGDAAHHVLPPAAAVPFLLFMLQVLAVRERAERVFWPCVLIATAALGFAVVCAIAPSPARSWLATATVIATAAIACGLTLWTWPRDARLARRIVAAHLPFALGLCVHAAHKELGRWVEEHALVMLLAGLALTICATYLLLGSRSQLRRDSHRRIAQLHEIDPLTGLVNDSVFANRLVELIDRSQRFDHQSVVAFVDFPNFSALRSEFGRKHALALLLRIAERLNAMMRTVDTVARLGESRFGFQVDGPVGASRARALCAKVVAHCITPMAGLPMGMVPKPRIALALVPAHGAVAQDVLARLEQMLREAADDPSRVILLADMDVVKAAPAAIAPKPAPSSYAATDFLPTSATEHVE